MENSIQKIIEVDLEAQRKVKEANAKHDELLKNRSQHKQEIYDQLLKEYTEDLESKKSESKQRILAAQEADSKELESTLSKLDEIYEANKDQWVKSIVERCKGE